MRVPIRLIIVLAWLVLNSLLQAQVFTYQELMESKRIALAYDPTNDRVRCELAYYQMLAGLPEQALENYRTALSRDGTNPDARAGELWALNTLSRYKESIALAKQYLASNPVPLPRYHLANALLATRKSYAASHQYRKVLAGSDDPIINAMALENLAWAYIGAGDQPRAEAVFKELVAKAGHTSDPELKATLRKLTLSAETILGIKSNDAMFWSLTTGVRYRAFSLGLTFDQFRLEGSRLRDNYRIRAGKQFIPADIALVLQSITGTDSRIYPGSSMALSISPKAYLGPLQTVARLAVNASTFKRHNAYQYDLGITLRSDFGSLGYQAAKIYQDNEAMNSDTSRWVHTLDLNAPVWKGWRAGLHIGSGNLAWYTNPQGSITDDFEPVDSYAGLSLSIPVLKRARTILYYQYGSNDDTSSHLAYASLYAWF
jgi:tetratricopeptide (TPR) repeat protein